MSRRIEVELTSDRADGSWTWRAAGARLPKGDLDGQLLYEGAKVGDVVKAEADFDVDGITILAVFPPKGARSSPETIEVIGSGRDTGPLVTSQLTSGRRPDRGADRARREERDGQRARRGARPERAPRSDGPSERPRREAPRAPRLAPLPPRPKAKKLRPGRANRDSLVTGLPAEQQAIAEQILVGGLPAVRQAIDQQNTKAAAEGMPTVPVDAILTIAESLVPRLQVADWLDRAEAAMADVEEISLRDLRAVVTSADVVRSEATRELGTRLREALERRSAAEADLWNLDLRQSVEAGRLVRALRLTSRSPEASVGVPEELAKALTEAVNAAMTPETSAERWVMLIDAIAFSTVRGEVTPAGVPSEVSEEVISIVRKHAGRVPGVAKAFGIEVPAAKPKGGVKAKKVKSIVAPHRDAVRGPSVVVGGRRIPPPPPSRRVLDEPTTSSDVTSDQQATETDGPVQPSASTGDQLSP